jgi:hypothetical protein
VRHHESAVQIDWAQFTPWGSLAGGILISFTSIAFALLLGRIAGISGIVRMSKCVRSGCNLTAATHWDDPLRRWDPRTRPLFLPLGVAVPVWSAIIRAAVAFMSKERRRLLTLA